MTEDERFMAIALEEARRALAEGKMDKWDIIGVPIYWDQREKKWESYEKVAESLHEGWEPYAVVPTRGATYANTWTVDSLTHYLRRRTLA